MDLDNEELIATKYAEIKEVIKEFQFVLGLNNENTPALNIDKAVIVRRTTIEKALKYLKNYMGENKDEGEHIPRID